MSGNGNKIGLKSLFYNILSRFLYYFFRSNNLMGGLNTMKFLNNKITVSFFVSLILLSTVSCSCKSMAMDQNSKKEIGHNETLRKFGKLTKENMEWMIKNIDFFGNSVEKINSKSVYSIVDVDKFYDNQKDGDRHEKK